ncbi:MAG: elongation factor Ts [Acidobacteria bacterium]|nr:elongation factor Ts [Acidobacteriota bacterium]MCH8986222.1 elongation factor Ts [Acidobacteriota bacterium]
MPVTAKDVQTLRKATGAGIMDVKRALTETDGDMDLAKDLLRERGITAAEKRSERTQSEGTIGMYLHEQAGRPVIGVTVLLASETDFVAKSEDFQSAANDIAMHIAASAPKWITVEDVPQADVDKERDLIAAQAENEGKSSDIVERIVDGRIKSFYADYVLSEQKFVRSDKFEGTVGAMVTDLAARMGENVSVTAMARLAVGEEM